MGRAGVLLLLGLLVFLGGGLAVLFTGLRSGLSKDTRQAPARTGAETSPAEPVRLEADVAPPSTADSSTAPPDRAAEGLTLVVEVVANELPWAGAFELWLEHVPRPGSRVLREGAFLPATGASIRVERLAAATYRGFARAPGRRSAEFQVELGPTTPEELVRVELAHAGVVRGRITNGAAGLDGLALRLRSRGVAHVDATRTDADGRFEFGHVFEGEHVLEVGPRFDPIVKDWAVELRGVELDLGDRVIAELTSLSIRVVDAAGRPVAGARVHDGAISGHFDLVTDEHGGAIARHLPLRQYRVFAEHAVHGAKNLPIRIEAPEPARIELVLPR